MHPPTPPTPDLLYTNSPYDFAPYQGNNEDHQIAHQLKQLKKIFLESDDIKFLQESLNRVKPLKTTLYYLLDKICDKKPLMAEAMLTFKQYHPGELAGMLLDALENSDNNFFDKLVNLNIGDAVKSKILNRALHIAVESHGISADGEYKLDQSFQIATLIDLGADPLNETEYIGPGTDCRHPLAIASTKVPPDKQLIKLLIKALPD